ncbi:putative Ig domain-containing protein [Spirosoma sp. SC4-14]|uniref:putative Ig domain-containing protein n=1 Tax=Spirosoma sp. SC4-14 TaxID=3128900 RepID=UPI0030D44302
MASSQNRRLFLWLAISLLTSLGNQVKAQSTSTSLAVTKQVDKTKANLGDTLAYTVTLTNNGSSTVNNIDVRDSLGLGIRFLPASVNTPNGSNFNQGSPISIWHIGSLSAGQSLKLTFQAVADSMGVLYARATIPGATAGICTSIPVKVCPGTTISSLLTAPAGRMGYHWFKNGSEITDQTTNILYISSTGTYSVRIDNGNDKCNDISCCDLIIEEDPIPTFQAQAIAATCDGNSPRANGQIVLANFNSIHTYQYSEGSSFNAGASLSGGAKRIPANGIIASNLNNPSGNKQYTIRVYNTAGCYTDHTVTLTPTTCSAQPKLAVVLTPGSCDASSNLYSVSGTISLTAAIASTLTITDGNATTTVSITNGQTSATFTLGGLTSGTGNHTLSIAGNGYTTLSSTYSAPVSCNSNPPTNTAPTVANVLAPQSATVGQAFSYSIPANTFTDKETPNTLTVTVAGLANGLSFTAPATISGTLSSTAGSPLTITVTATDAGGLSVSTPLVLNLYPANVTNPGTFAITSVNTLTCVSVSTTQRQVTFQPVYSGIDGSAIAFTVLNELASTTNSGPYTLRLYTDNPTITLQAQQAGKTATYSYNWLANCSSQPTNTAPTVANALAPQSATVGQAFSYSIPPNTFTDKETPNSLTITVAGLTNGLSFSAPATISGTPSSTVGSPLTLTVTATDAGGLSISTPMRLTIAPATVTNPTPFTITAVNTLSCVALSTTQRQITFQPTYAGTDATPITLSSVGALASTTATGPFTVQLYTDNPTITLQAQQAGKTATYSYNWLANCSSQPTNTAPTVANALAPQSATVGQAFTYSIPNNTFTDKETPNSLTITVAGLTNGLSFTAPATISGTPSSTVGSPLTLTVTATDAGGLAVSTPMLLTIAPATVTNPTPFTITAVNTLSCVALSTTQRQITFQPTYAGTDATPITLSSVGALASTTATGPFTVQLYTDNPTITLQAQQAGKTATYSYNWLANCSSQPTNTAPTVANVLAPQSATVGEAFTYSIPANTFTDKETPNSLTITVAGLTNGLSFTAPTTISGTPSTTVGSPLTLTVTATDAGGLAVSTPMLLTIVPQPAPTNTAPTVANALAPQSATVGQAFTYSIPANTFTDKETPNSLTITVAGLTNGLSFSAPATISGTPSSTVGSPLTLTVTATDAGGLSISTPMLLTIVPQPAPTNTAPTVANALAPQSATVGEAFTYSIPNNTFTDKETPNSLTITVAGLTNGLSFSAPATISGTPSSTVGSPLTLTVTATDAGGLAVSTPMLLTIVPQPAPTNTAPTVANALAPQSATVGEAFTYSIPANTFTDKETPNSLTITVAGLTNGLSFSAPATISGTPSSTVGSPLTLTVTATDAGGLSISTPMRLTIAPATVTNPTPFTITAVNTLSCVALSTTQRQISFQPTYAGTDATPITLSSVGALASTTATGPFTVQLYTDNPTITLQAQQAGKTATYSYNWLANCSSQPTNTAPTVANALAPQSATVGQAFTYSIPASTFTDKETPNSLTITVAGLTNGLSFTAPTTISGTPSTTVGSPLTLTVTATDAGGLAVSTPMLLTIVPQPAPVNTAPTVANALTPQSATVGQAFTYSIPANTFTDKETPNSLTITVAGLTNGLSFTAPATISGTPSTTVGSPLTLTVTATDAGGLSISTPMRLTIAPATVTNPTPFTITAVNTLSCVALSTTQRQITFQPIYSGLDGSPVSFSVVNELVPTTQAGPYTLKLYTDNPTVTLQAQQTDKTASYKYNWLANCEAAPSNTAPTVAHVLAPQSATVGQAFSYSIPANTFTDKETPNNLTIAVAGLTNGLSFSAPATISGTPSTTVGSPLTLTVTATDAGGLSISTPMRLTIVPQPAPVNTAPTVANALAPQSATVGEAFTYSIPASTFTDKETPNSLTITVAGLTNGLSFTAPATISGTPSTTVGSPLTLTVTATDAGGLAVSTPMLLTIAPATVTNPTPFTITAVNTLSCVALSTTQRQISFQPTYAGTDATPITLSSVGALASTTATGPFTVQLYTDNPTITLQAQQAGKTATYSYNWLANCSSQPTNTAPTVANALAPQSATVGQAFSYSIPPNTFTDKETPNSLTITVAGLTNGLAFSAPATISGTPSSTVGSPLTLTVTATDAGGLAVSTPMLLTIAPATVTNPTPFTITAVNTLSCVALSTTQRQITFQPTYSGLDGSPVSFSVVNELVPTTQAGPYTLTLYTDNPTVTLQAQQTDKTASYKYNWLANCGNTEAPVNTAPTVANALAPQSATVGEAFTYSIPANTFTDKETPNSLTITVAGLTNGLSFTAPTTISGTPSTTVGSPLTLTVTATDAGGLSISTPMLLTIVPQPAPVNTAPTVANALAPQSATVGQAFTYSIPNNTFTDKETPNSLTIAVAGLTNGLSFSAPATISGTPSTTVGSPLTLTVTATDAGGLSISTPMRLTIVPATVTNPTPFTITAVNTLSCVALSTTQRQITFQPIYSGLDGSPVSFSVVNELVPTTQAGPYTLKLYTDNPTVTLQAQQTDKTASYKYNWLASCGANSAPGNSAPTAASAITVAVTPGSCDPTTDHYSITGAINLTAATAGTLLVTDGTSTTVVTILDGQTLARFTLAGLPSGTGSHTVTITGTDYPTASTTYIAPESCAIGITTSATAGACNALSNQYDVSGVLSLTNAQNGIATITDGVYSTTVSVSAGNVSIPYSLTGLLSGTGGHTITVDYLSQIVSTTYTAPEACTVSAVCSLTTVVTPGACENVTNTYSATAVVSLSNSTTGIVTVTNGIQSFTFAATVTPSATFTAVFDGLLSDGNSHTIVASLPNCSTLTTTYTAPGSCTQVAGSQLSLFKQVDKSKAYMGDTLSYTLILTNIGSTAATNVVVRDSATTGLTYVANSATAPVGTTFTTGVTTNTWLIATLSPAQSLTLTLKAKADSTGILHSTATIPGDTATVCTTIPVKVCAGDEYLYRLTAPLGYATYQWYKDGQAILGATTNSLDVSTPGSYSLAVDNAIGQCPDFSCCPFIVEEDSLPTFQAIAIPATCIGNKPQTNAQLVLSNVQTGYTYQYSAGATFDEAAPLSGSAQVIPVGGTIASNLPSPAVAQAYTIRVYNSSGCYTDVTVLLQPTVCGCPAEICVPFVIQQTKRGPRIGDAR